MSEHTKMRRTDSKKKMKHLIIFQHAGKVYKISKSEARKYICDDEELVDSASVFLDINKKYTKPGALLRGLRVRENLTQHELAKKIHVTQSDVSQMESGERTIGKTVAKRIEKFFDVNYRSFLA